MHCWIHLYPLDKTRWAWQFYFHWKISQYSRLLWWHQALVTTEVLLTEGNQDHWPQWTENSGVKLHGICTERMCNLELQLICWPRGGERWCFTNFQPPLCWALKIRILLVFAGFPVKLSQSPVVVLVCTRRSKSSLFFSFWLQPPVTSYRNSFKCWIAQFCDFIALIYNVTLRHSEIF